MNEINIKENANIADDPGEAYLESIVDTVKTEDINMNTDQNMNNMQNNNQPCIDECNKCAQSCFECFKACLNEPDVQARKTCIGILVECAQMCQMSSAFMSMNSEFSKDHCKLCATVCDKCAQECSMFKDDHCKVCADECRKCADECRKMAGV